MIDPTIQEWLYAREMMRRLGFTPEELFFEVYTSGQAQDPKTGVIIDLGGPVIALLVRRAEITFTWTIGATYMAVSKIQGAYEAAVEEWNSDGYHFDLEAFRASRSMSRATELMIALKAKGFRLENG